jgi:NAD(P)-dependent dehydrogenase (short-subunit alcohol dehydrogenase family)
MTDKSGPVRFDGRVALVTGAGGGMGRAYAIALAARGARVVANDYGGDMFGAGGSASYADAVVEEIRAAGGEAIGVDTPVGEAHDARKIVELALSAYGRLDILINNAGISAPGAIDALGDARVEAVLRTNLIGALHLMRAAWPTMSSQGYGRILNISSSAALGKGGSAAYAASKAGLIGLTLDAAQEGVAVGISANALLPTAYSRMIEAVPDRNFVAWMKTALAAEKIVPAVLYLLSDQSSATGRIFSAGGGRVARLAYVEAPGLTDARSIWRGRFA